MYKIGSTHQHLEENILQTIDARINRLQFLRVGVAVI